MALSDIVNVTVTKTTATISRAGFGYGLILSTQMRFASRLQWVNQSAWATEMVALGFATTDAAYVAASDYFAQNPAPTKVAIGVRKGSQITVAIDTVSNSTAYTIEIETAGHVGTWNTYTYTSDATATQTEIADGLLALINAGETEVVASNVSDDVQIDAVGGALFAVRRPSAQSTLMTVGAPAGTIEDSDTALTAIKLADDDWYGIASADDYSTSQQTDAEKIMAWAESNRKLFICRSTDTAMLAASDTSSVAYTANSNTYAYTAVFYHSAAATEYIDAAALGACLPYDPGSQTWAFKSLSSITVDSTLTTTQRGYAAAMKANVYVSEGSRNITLWGTTGEDYIDVTRGIDWLRVNMQADLVDLLISQRKVAFTDKGIATVEGIVQKRLRLGVANKLLAELDDDAVGVPLVANVSTANKSARTLTSVTWKATLAGAIHKMTPIAGTVSV